MKHKGHRQEVCGLKWSFDGNYLASGGNDNKLCIWNLSNPNPIMKSDVHSAAVKALAWSPFQQNVLASGGGTADKTIRFWNMKTMQNTSFKNTGSQVCNLVFSKNSNELISTHGFSLNHINLWNLKNMNNISTLSGHQMRVLYLAISPDGENIITGAGDETLRFWNVFPQKKSNTNNSSLILSNVEIR
jgi:cell division cycle 20-like protein 1 (cofactor of APC complex)